jgi:hypothetical protein
LPTYNNTKQTQKRSNELKIVRGRLLKRLQTPLHVLQHAEIILFSGSHTYTRKKSISSVYCENNFVKVKLATLETD